MILNFAQDKVGVVDFTKAHGLVKFRLVDLFLKDPVHLFCVCKRGNEDRTTLGSNFSCDGEGSLFI